MRALSEGALDDLGAVFTAMKDDARDGLIEEIVKAKRIVVFGLGRAGIRRVGSAPSPARDPPSRLSSTQS